MQPLPQALESILDPDRVLTRWIDRVARANDASVYRLVPRAVVRPRTTEEIRALFRLCRERRLPLTFRAAGTSLSGQAVTSGLLLDLSQHWRGIEVLDSGARVRVRPGAIAGEVNRALRAFGSKIGPDPASIESCMMGGILANNSSGMCCGVEQNAYHTLESIRFVLPSGLEIDTADPSADERLSAGDPALVTGLLDLTRRVRANPALVARIRRKYAMKNTMGYSLNAFLDHDRPAEILAHLLIGSEGTLAFIAEAVLRTVPDPPLRWTGLLLFEGISRACDAIGPLAASGARALELMDRASLRAIEAEPGAPPEARHLGPAAAALLVEYQCHDADALEIAVQAAERALARLATAGPVLFTQDPVEQAALWRLRRGLIPFVGATRRPGTSFILEDIVFPVAVLATGVGELQRLFVRHGYDDAIVFGHAKDGNLHFVLAQAFEREADVVRYDHFMQDLAELVAVRHGGALKAEHGTGRNMAPFVAAEWGEDALAIMRRLKYLIDPDGILNPGVILNDDPRAHVTHLKELHKTDPEIDACIECGFCERVCPSRDLTLTPRQRIVVRREMARLRAHEPGSAILRELTRDFDWDGTATCAADGLCATACPVAIDTGRLIKRLRSESHSAATEAFALRLAEHLGWIENGARMGLGLARATRRLVGARAFDRGLRAATGRPIDARLLEPTARLTASLPAEPAAVYFPACVSRICSGSPSLSAAVVRVGQRAGLPFLLPDGVRGHCCGLAFGSRGFPRAAKRVATRLGDALESWTDGGRLPVVVDASPCAAALDDALRAQGRSPAMTVFDGIAWLHDVLLPRLAPHAGSRAVGIHTVCSVTRAGLAGKLEGIARACAATVYGAGVPRCCGFAGDRGFTVPALTEAATSAWALAVSVAAADGVYSSSPTCEIGLERATGRAWRSYWHLVDEATELPVTVSMARRRSR